MERRYLSRVPARAIALVFGLTVGAGVAVQANAASYDPPDNPPVVSFGVKPAAPWMNGAAVELITNGGFESGLTGWTVVNQAGGFGDWFFTGALTGPLSGLALAPPPQGALQAVSDQTGAGSHILYQDVVIPPASSVALSLIFWWNNSAMAFYNPATLDFNVNPNQQFRIDLMNPAAPVDDMGAGVLSNLFTTVPASPPTQGYSVLNVNLTAFSGQTVRLRIAEVDNQLYFNVGIDAVSIQAEPSVPAVPASWGAVKDRYR